MLSLRGSVINVLDAIVFFFKHKTAYELRISDWSSDVCSSDLILRHLGFRRMTQTDRRALSRWISDDLCAGGQPINAMLEHVFLWCRDRRIYGPSRKEAQSARSCDFGHLGEHVGNGLVVVDDRPCEERRSAPIRERRSEPWRFEWGSDRLLEPEFFGHRVRDRQSGDGTTGIGGSA